MLVDGPSAPPRILFHGSNHRREKGEGNEKAPGTYADPGVFWVNLASRAWMGERVPGQLASDTGSDRSVCQPGKVLPCWISQPPKAQIGMRSTNRRPHTSATMNVIAAPNTTLATSSSRNIPTPPSEAAILHGQPWAYRSLHPGCKSVGQGCGRACYGAGAGIGRRWPDRGRAGRLSSVRNRTGTKTANRSLLCLRSNKY
jgi:hypothetical protein